MMFAAISAAGATMSPAATWSGGGTNNNWNNSANWGGSTPPSNLFTPAIFTGSTRTTPDATLGICSSITFDANAASFNLGPVEGGGGLQIGSGGVTNNSANAQSIVTSMFLQASQTWTNNGGLLSSTDYLNVNAHTLTLMANQPIKLSALWGSGSIIKNGAATLKLDPTLTSALFTGTLTINEGVVEASKTGTYPNNIRNIDRRRNGHGHAAPHDVQRARSAQLIKCDHQQLGRF